MSSKESQGAKDKPILPWPGSRIEDLNFDPTAWNPNRFVEEWKYSYGQVRDFEAKVGSSSPWTVSPSYQRINLENRSAPDRFKNAVHFSNLPWQSFPKIDSRFENKFIETLASLAGEPLLVKVEDGKTVTDLVSLPTVQNGKSIGVLAIEVGEDSIVDFHLGSDGTDPCGTHFVYTKIGSGSKVDVYLENDIINNSKKMLGSFVFDLDENATLNLVDVSWGGKLNRRNIEVNLNGAGSKLEAHGIYLVEDGTQLDTQLRVNHRSSQSFSEIKYHGILGGTSRGVYGGQVYIEPNAQKVDSSQMSRVLLLSDRAEADVKPELDVFADDVKAAHGSAIGQLSDEEVFYLMSRGVSRRDAVVLISKGFARSPLNFIRDRKLFERLTKKLQVRLDSMELEARYE